MLSLSIFLSRSYVEEDLLSLPQDMESWKFLHERIVRLMSRRPPGFFVEAGALDGEYLSNTLYLEKVCFVCPNGCKSLLI